MTAPSVSGCIVMTVLRAQRLPTIVAHASSGQARPRRGGSMRLDLGVFTCDPMPNERLGSNLPRDRRARRQLVSAALVGFAAAARRGWPVAANACDRRRR